MRNFTFVHGFMIVLKIMQVYLSLYTMLGFVEDQVTSGASTLTDSLFISSLKVISVFLAFWMSKITSEREDRITIFLTREVKME